MDNTRIESLLMYLEEVIPLEDSSPQDVEMLVILGELIPRHLPSVSLAIGRRQGEIIGRGTCPLCEGSLIEREFTDSAPYGEIDASLPTYIILTCAACGEEF